MTTHPGILLRAQVFPALELSVSQAARDLRVARQTLHRVLAGDAAVSADMALRLEKLCGISGRFWLERQSAYELARAAQYNRVVLSNIPSYRLSEICRMEIGAADEV
jgi:antitoxin HigA-1